jgi:hypothetical protein
MPPDRQKLCLHVRHQAFQILAQLPEEPEEAVCILKCALRLLEEGVREAELIELKVVR